jgi:hypothetical protein
LNRRRCGAAVVGWLVVAAGCAHVEPPPGGPDDTTPPSLLTSRPEAEAIVPTYDGPAVLVFDERISEQRLEDAVNVSPRTSPVIVSHGRDEIRVSLRQGWVPGVIYHVGVSREVRDLFNNSLAQPIRLVFSTGPEIPETSLTGGVLDRITGQPETEVRVEAIRDDSLVYATSTDSVGGFAIEQFPEGEYRVRAFRDLNRNRALDEFEARDSADATIRVGEAPEVALRVVDPDSTGPVPGAATLAGLIVRVEFDDFLDPEQELQPTQASVRDSTGATVPVERVALGEVLELPADTIPTAPGAVDPPPPQDSPPAPATGVALPPGELPSRIVSVQLDEGATLAVGAEYTLTLEDVRNVVGLTGGGETTFDVPEAQPDSVTAPPPAL